MNRDKTTANNMRTHHDGSIDYAYYDRIARELRSGAVSRAASRDKRAAAATRFTGGRLGLRADIGKLIGKSREITARGNAAIANPC